LNVDFEFVFGILTRTAAVHKSADQFPKECLLQPPRLVPARGFPGAIETRLLPALTRSYPRPVTSMSLSPPLHSLSSHSPAVFTCYVAGVIRIIHLNLALPYGEQKGTIAA